MGPQTPCVSPRAWIFSLSGTSPVCTLKGKLEQQWEVQVPQEAQNSGFLGSVT